MLSHQSDRIRAHTEGRNVLRSGWLNKVQVRWLGLAIKWGFGPTLCVGGSGAMPESGEKAYACAFIHMLNPVGFWTRTPPFGTYRGIPRVSFWELRTGEHNHSFLTFGTSQRPLLQVQMYLFLSSKSGLLLCSLDS